MARLCLCINQVAKFRNSLKKMEPDPVAVAIAAEIAGIDGIVAHLKEDRSDITDRDVSVLKEVVRSHFNLAIPMNDDMVKKALHWLPDMVTLVPATREENQAESLDVTSNLEYIEDVVTALRANNIVVNVLIEPDIQQLRAAARVRVDYVQLNCTPLKNIEDLGSMNDFIENLKSVAIAANKLGLGVSLGRGIDFQNLKEMNDVPYFEEFNIGKAIIARSVVVGVERAIQATRNILKS